MMKKTYQKLSMHIVAYNAELPMADSAFRINSDITVGSDEALNIWGN